MIGFKTGSRKVASHVVKQKDIIFVFKSAYEPGSEECKMMGEHLVAHGDGVKDVAVTVKDLEGIIERCKANGVKVVKDDVGKVCFAKVQTVGDTTHTLSEGMVTMAFSCRGTNNQFPQIHFLQLHRQLDYSVLILWMETSLVYKWMLQMV